MQPAIVYGDVVNGGRWFGFGGWCIFLLVGRERFHACQKHVVVSHIFCLDSAIALFPGVIHIALEVGQRLVGRRELSPIRAGISKHTGAFKRSEYQMHCCGVGDDVYVSCFCRKLLDICDARVVNLHSVVGIPFGAQSVSIIF